MREIQIAMNGITGRMGRNQHLLRSILSIRAEGGIPSQTGEMIMPTPILIGRNEAKLRRISEELLPNHGTLRYTTDVDSVLSDPKTEIFFDASLTQVRAPFIEKAIDAGKAVYCEKPVATDTEMGLKLYRKARAAGVKNGIVQDKLWLPGMLKLKYLIDTGFFGKILSVRGEFGYWVFDGFHQPTQRPSWNYRKEEGGGIMVDMFCHWRYVIDNLFGEIDSVYAEAATHIHERLDEEGERYTCTADDAAYGIFTLKNGIICQFNSSWAVRVHRSDLLTLQVDGTEGSAVAGLRDCVVQHDSATPKPIWNPDIDSPIDYTAGWSRVPTRDPMENAFKAQWKLFLKHVVDDEPFPWDLLEGAKGVQLAELGQRSSEEKRNVRVPTLE